MNSTGIILSEASLHHDTGLGHPERVERFLAIKEKLEIQSYFKNLVKPELKRASLETIALAHTKKHLENLKNMEGKFGKLDPDTIFSKYSFDAVLDAAGAGITLADEILNGNIKNGIAIVRPPGHHAEEDKAMGFCFVNNIALCAKYLISKGIQKIFILDWDVHHGNGTEKTFYSDDKVFFTSLHQFPFYPGTGKKDDKGNGKGLGYTLNIPLHRDSDDFDYTYAMKEMVIPTIDKYEPEFILISAGFDAHKSDPLGGMELTTKAFETFTKLIKDRADAICQGRIISFLEGGYDLDALSESVETHLSVLVG